MAADPRAALEQQKMQLEAQKLRRKQMLDAIKFQNDQFIAQTEFQAQTQDVAQQFRLKRAEQQLKEREKAQQLQAKGAQEAREQANAPVLDAPQRMDMTQPRPDMETMGGVDANSMALAQGGPPQQGSGMAPPTAPPQAGPAVEMGTPQGGVTAPAFLERLTVEQGTRRTPFGYQPTERKSYGVIPNVLTAEQAAHINLSLARDRQKSYDLYLDRLAKVGAFAKTPGQRKAFEREVQRLAQSDPRALSALEQRIAVVQADVTKHGLQNPTEVYDPKSPTGTRLVPQDEALDQPGLRLAAARAKGAAEGSALGAALGGALSRLFPTAPTTNALQESQINATNALSRINSIYESFDPRFLQLPDQMFAAGSRFATKLGMSVDPETADFMERFGAFKQNVQENLAKIVYEQSGKQTNEREAERLKETVPSMDDDRITFPAKLDNFRAKQIAIVIRNQWLLMNGLGTRSIADALQAMPQLEIQSGAPGAPDPGFDNVMAILDEAQTRAEMAVREEADRRGVTLQPNAVKSNALDNLSGQFGVPRKELEFLLGQ